MTELPSWRIKRRQAIVAAAARLFSREPFEHVQMDEIAREAGLGKPTLYRYFPSKQDLYLAVCETAFLDLEKRLDAAARGGPPPEALRRMIAALVTLLDEQIATLSILDQEAAPFSNRWRALFRRHRQAIAAALRGVLEAGVERSDFHNLDLDIVPGLIIGTIRGALIANQGIPRKRLIEQTTAFVLNGLGAGADERRANAPKILMRARGFGVS